MNKKLILGILYCFAAGVFFFARAQEQDPLTSFVPQNAIEEARLRAQLRAREERDDLERKIRGKSEELERITKELEAAHSNLKATQEQKATLQREFQRLQADIHQLELSIQSDQVTSQKLGLEIDSLRYDMRDIELTVSDKSAAIIHLLRELQKTSDVSPFISFLRSPTLADGVWETQSLKNLRNQLDDDVQGLISLRAQLDDKVQQVSAKKTAIDAHQKNLTNRKLIVQDQKEARKNLLAQTKNKETVYQQQAEELKKQQDALSDEIEKIEEELRSKFDTGLLPTRRPGVFRWPVTMIPEGGKGRITQHFGERSNLYRGRPHNGLDIGAPIGTPVYAASDGIVMAVDNNDRSRVNKYQYGKYVLIKHPNGLATLYAHLSSQTVVPGQSVRAGELIGYVGATGYATGAHLHFGAYWSASVTLKPVPPAAGLVPIGVVVRPEDYL